MRHTFGMSLADFTLGMTAVETTTTADVTGLPAVVVGGQIVTFWNAPAHGEQYVDLRLATTGEPGDPGGEAVTQVMTSPGADDDPPRGVIPMILGPDGVTRMWAQVGEVPVATAADGAVTADSDTDDGGTVALDASELGGAGSGRMLIVASTAHHNLDAAFTGFRDATDARLDDLERRADAVDVHLDTHDRQIAELQTNTGGGGGGTGGSGMIVGRTDERPTATPGAMFLDYQTSRIWIGILDYTGSTAVWSPIPGTQVFSGRATHQVNLPHTVDVTISLDQVDIDLLGGYSATRPTRFSPTVPGYYLLDGAIGFAGNNDAAADTIRWTRWSVNGAFPAAGTATGVGARFYTTVLNARSFSVYLNGAGDYVELVGQQNSKVTLTTAETSWGQAAINAVYQGGSPR